MSMNLVVRFLFIIFCFILVAPISGCGQGQETGSANADTGSAVFSILWPDDAPGQGAAKALGNPTIDCTGISAIKVEVYEDPVNRYLADKSFDCSLGAGTVGGIEVGSNRRVVVSALGGADTLLFQGEKGNITISKNEVTDVGPISLGRVGSELPVAMILEPLGGTFSQGEKITFRGGGEDAEDGTLSGPRLQWVSDIDENIGQGSQIVVDDLSPGNHTITLTVTDNHGDVGTDTIKIMVSELPEANILQPLGGTFIIGEEITFEGSGQDAEDGPLPGSQLQWESDIDGLIGDGAHITSSELRAGHHTITLRVTDSHGGAGTATIRIVVNELPEANIVQPQARAFVFGDEVTFEGSGQDAEDGQLSDDHLQWESDIQGTIGEGRQFSRDNLSFGTHTITLRVTDSDEGVDTTTIQITIYGESNNSIGMRFSFIPAGTFTMGSPVGEWGANSAEIPHKVTLTRPFHIQTTEVTQGQWKAVIAEDNNPSHFDCGDDCPVEEVTWYDGVVFCNLLSEKEDLTPSYYADSSYTTVFKGTPPVKSGDVYWDQNANGYRLPTEAEWEYAARAGSTTAFANGGITVFDDTLPCNYDPNLSAMGWYCFDNIEPDKGTKPVAQKNANAWGLFDMHGNVEEWCQDRNGRYPDYDVVDPIGSSSGPNRMFRGCSYLDVAALCRSGFRFSREASEDWPFQGFRVVLPPGQPGEPSW